MEAYAYQLLTIGQFASLALSWVIMTVSAAAAVALTKSQWKLGRAGYFLSMGFIVLLTVIPNFLLLYTAEAIKNEHLALLVGAIYGALVPVGGLAGIFAAARSMDAHGTREKWVLGFIPIVNLFLLFAQPMASSKKGFVKLLGAVATVILGFALMFAGKSLESIAKQNIQRVDVSTQDDVALVAKKMAYEAKNKGLEKYLKEIANAVPVPEKIDSITTLTALKAEGNALKYTYEISGADFKFDKAWKDLMMSRWCAPEVFKPMFDIGALVTGHYVDTKGNTLAEISVSPSLCDVWRLNR
ncbi:UNVERIFIED_ORG: hypothetical protein LHK14_07325 [Roseateles sp. XES5]|nr:hypothetical protein [Roseateles sp. XES5]